MLKDKLKLALIAGISVAICGIVVFSEVSIVKAEPTSTSISIKAQDYTTDVSAITFPEGAVGDTVSLPTNGVGAEVQTFGIATVAKPVVTLLNEGSVPYTIYYNITSWSPSGVVVSEYYLINDKGAACANADAINQGVTFDSDEVTTATITNGAGNEKDLYLKITLGTTAGQAATSTLTILGESE